MADDILITVGANVKGVVTAIDTTKRLENRVKKLQTALDTGRVSSNQFDAALAKTSKSAKGYEKAVLDYANSLKAAKKAQEEAAAADQKAKQEAKAFAQARKEATEANRAFDAQRKRDIAAANQQAQEEERLRRKFIEGHAAMELYSKELNDLAVARKAGIITAEQQRQGLERLNQQMASGTGVFSAYGSAVQEATARNNRMGVVMQQSGYQVGDFLVQIQSGTSPMVAFGQQATQLAGVMTMFGGKMLVIGSILGIAIPLVTAIGAAFLRSRQEAAKAAGDVKTLDDELKSLDSTLQDWVRTKKAAEAGVTIEELLGGEGLDAAKENLKAAREELEKFSAVVMSPGFGAAGGINLGSLLEAAGLKESEADKVTKAAEAYIKAIERIGQIEQKQAEDQYQTFAEEDRQLRQQIQLQQQILKTGEDSAEVRKLSLEQEIANYNRVIDQQVRSNELTETQGRLLKEQNEDYLRLVESGNKVALTLEDALRLTQQITGVDLKGAFNQAAASVSTMNSRLDLTLDKIRGILGAIGSIGFDTIAIEAETKALQAGQSVGQARVEGQMAQMKARLSQSGPIGPIEQMALTTQRSALEARMKAEAARQAELDKLKPTSKSGGGGKSEAEQLAERIANFEKQLRLEEELVGVSEARKRVLQALGVEFVNNNQAAVANYEAQIEAITEATRLEEQRKQLMQTVESSLESGFMAMVDGTKSVKDAFKDMARQIIAELYRVLVVQRLVGAISGAIGGIGGGSSLAPTTSLRPPVRPFADGGVIGSPTMFPMSGGQTGLMGEAGPEAIMPLKRDKNGRLGVSVEGGSGSVVVNNNINVTGGSDPAAIRMEVAKLMPQITAATKTAVIDARRRGGQMKAAFS